MHVLDKETLRNQLVTERNINKQLKHDIDLAIDICDELLDGMNAYDLTDQIGREVDFCINMVNNFNKLKEKYND